MKKFLFTALLAASSLGAAQSIDCSTVKVASFLALTYTEKAAFPNPSKESYNSLSKPTNFNQCGYIINSDGNHITIKATTKELLKRVVNNTDSNGVPFERFSFPFVGFSGYKYPAISEGFYSYDVWYTLNLTTGDIGTFDLTSESLAVISTLKSASAGYKINGGPIIPFYYEGKISKGKFDPATTKTIDFYAIRSTYDDGYDRILFDIPNNTIELWKKHEFPKS